MSKAKIKGWSINLAAFPEKSFDDLCKREEIFTNLTAAEKKEAYAELWEVKTGKKPVAAPEPKARIEAKIEKAGSTELE